MKHKRILSLVLCIVLMLGMMTQAAVSAATRTVETVIADGGLGASALIAGKKITLSNGSTGSATCDSATDVVTLTGNSRLSWVTAFVPGRTYTFSAEIKAGSDVADTKAWFTSNKIAIDGGEETWSSKYFAVTTGEWTKCEWTFTYTGTETKSGQDIFVLPNAAAQTLLIRNICQIESYDIELEDFSGDSVDLSSTAKTAVEVGGTINLSVNGKDAAALSGLTYESSNEKVATVKDGVVTGVSSGLAVITAKYGDKSDSVMIMVGSQIATKDFGTWTDKTGAVLDKTLDRSGDGTGAVKLDGTADINGFNAGAANCQSFWYYDADPSKTSSDFFQLQGYKADTRINFWLFPFASEPFLNDTNSALVGTDSKPITLGITRSKGWHQVVLVTAEDYIKMYIDAEEVLSFARNPEANVNPSINFNGTISAADTVSFWIDDTVSLAIDEAYATPSVEIYKDVTSAGTVTPEGSEKSYNSYIVYATITNYQYIENYGMILKNALGNTLDLPSGYEDSVVVTKLSESDGQFAFKVYGDAIDENICTLIPYIKTTDGTAPGNESEKFGNEPVA